MAHAVTAVETAHDSDARSQALAIKYAAMDFGRWAIRDKQQSEQVESPRIGASATTRWLYIDDDNVRVRLSFDLAERPEGFTDIRAAAVEYLDKQGRWTRLRIDPGDTAALQRFLVAHDQGPR